ncbi:MAG: molybdopterin converting factor subunit 1 [Pseudomonadales bacterium]|nr:molybdopterin converting factor subunit 1 [Pseudomonadales bacterium]
MIKVLYFARIREALGQDEEKIPFDSFVNVRELKAQLMARGGVWETTLGDKKGVLVAVNQEMASLDYTLDDGDEVAFFPPVTGG